MTFIAGPYSATAAFASTTADLGTIEDGFELEGITYQELIRGDNLGDSVQDGVYRGQDIFLSATFLEWDKEVLHYLMNPYGGSTGSTLGEIGQVGRLATSLAVQIVLTPAAGTTAAAATITTGLTTPAIPMDTLTLPKCILAENFPVRFNFAARLRKIPLRFRVFPVAGVFFTWS